MSVAKLRHLGRIVGTIFVLFGATFLSSRSFGQAAQQATSPTPNLNSSADEVSIDLVVSDRHNRPILDLKPEEIAITDNGSPVTLTGLRLVNGREEESDHLITLVFDQLDPSLAKRARQIAANILKAVPENGFSLAVLSIDDRLRFEQGFTSDRKALGDAISAATKPEKSAKGGDLTPAEQQLNVEAHAGTDPFGKRVSVTERAQAQMLYSALVDSGRIELDQHAQPSLAGLMALVRSLHQASRRKAVIFFTQDRQMDSSAGDILKSIVGAANRADASIYPIDMNAIDKHAQEDLAVSMSPVGANGMVTAGATGSAMTALSQEALIQNSLPTASESWDIDKSPFQNLSRRTGGNLIGADDTLKKPMERMIQDMTTYYEASYLPSVREYDGKFRPTAVKPLRAGLSIRTSAGYYAMPPGTDTSTRPFELPLLNKLSEANLPTDIPFHAAILRMGELPIGNANTVAIEAPLSSLEILEDQTTKLYLARLSIIAQIKDSNGTVIERFSENTSRRGALEDIDEARSEVVTLQRHFTAAPGKYVLEVVLLDCNSEKASAERTAFEIPQTSGGPSLSDMVLVRRTDPISAKAAADMEEPLRHANDKVTPNLSGQLSRGSQGVSVFFITHFDAQIPDAPVLSVQLLKDGRLLRNDPITPHQVSGAEASSYLATFPVKALPDGRYEIKTTLSQAGKTATAGISFSLAGADSTGGNTDTKDADLSAPAVDSRPTGSLAISSPTDPIQHPPLNELTAILEDATQRALGYTASLPNFVCVEVTDRSLDARGKGIWEHRDKFTELLTYQGNEEKRRMLTLDGQQSYTRREGLGGTQSSGEFGGMLKSVFQASSKADFQWKETDQLGGEPVQVFDYRVARENSGFDLTAGAGSSETVGFHGQVFVDSATRGVRRLTMIADDVPKEFPVKAAAFSVDYDYFVINNHDYLLPASARINVRQGRRTAFLNEITFRDYRRFGSKVKILASTPEKVTP